MVNANVLGTFYFNNIKSSSLFIVIILLKILMFFSPLEQFSILKIVPIKLGIIDISFTNSSLLAVLSFVLIFLFYNFACDKAKLVPGSWQYITESLYEFVFFTLVTENIKKNGSTYFPILFSVFSFIFACNLMGMVPYSFTVTSHIAVTLALSMTTFIGINVVAIRTHGFHFVSFFLPAGAPLQLAPLLVAIEIVSYSFRVISLALRLFANMMSGHCLLKILAGFA